MSKMCPNFQEKVITITYTKSSKKWQKSKKNVEIPDRFKCPIFTSVEVKIQSTRLETLISDAHPFDVWKNNFTSNDKSSWCYPIDICWFHPHFLI